MTVVIPANVETPETLSWLVNSVGPVTVVIPANVDKPETLNCLVNSVGPVTVVIPANVETPETFSCCAVKLVTVVTPRVLTPVTTRLFVLTSVVAAIPVNREPSP